MSRWFNDTNMKRLAKWTFGCMVGIAVLFVLGPKVFSVNKIVDSGVFNVKESHHIGATTINSNATKSVIANTPNEYMSVLKALAKRLKEQKRPLIYAATNDAFIPLANSWLCNTMFMGVHDQILVITTDDHTKDYFSKRWPNITVISQPGDALHGDQEYGRVGYWRMNIKRMNWTLMLLELGVDVFMVEMDSIWFVNPIPDLQKLAEGVDIVTLRPNDIAPYACAGFVYIRPTEKSIKMWKKLLEKMRTYESWMKGMDVWDKTAFQNIKESDQGYLTQLVIRDKYGGITYRAAPYDKYPDGSWYYSTKKQKNPDVIQNNFIKGNRNKIQRAKKFKHWFVDEVTEKCDVNHVKAMTNGTRKA